MKNLVDTINEALINEAKIRDVKTTVGEYIAWYFGKKRIEDVDFDKDYNTTDFDLTSLEDEFDGDYRKQFDYLVAHKDDKITLKQEEDMEFNDISVEFEVDGVLFTPVSTDPFKK